MPLLLWAWLGCCGPAPPSAMAPSCLVRTSTSFLLVCVSHSVLCTLALACLPWTTEDNKEGDALAAVIESLCRHPVLGVSNQVCSAVLRLVSVMLFFEDNRPFFLLTRKRQARLILAEKAGLPFVCCFLAHIISISILITRSIFSSCCAPSSLFPLHLASSPSSSGTSTKSASS